MTLDSVSAAGCDNCFWRQTAITILTGLCRQKWPKGTRPEYYSLIGNRSGQPVNPIGFRPIRCPGFI